MFLCQFRVNIEMADDAFKHMMSAAKKRRTMADAEMADIIATRTQDEEEHGMDSMDIGDDETTPVTPRAKRKISLWNEKTSSQYAPAFAKYFSEQGIFRVVWCWVDDCLSSTRHIRSIVLRINRRPDRITHHQQSHKHGDNVQ